MNRITAVLVTYSLLLLGVYWIYSNHYIGLARVNNVLDRIDMLTRTEADVHETRSRNMEPVTVLDHIDRLARTEAEVYETRSLNMELVTILHLVYDNATDKIIREREKEYVTALQSNLNHDHVKRIHVLSTKAHELEERLRNHYQLSNRSKLLIVERNSTNRTRDIIILYDYISENLIGVDVMHLNGDIYLGGGFDRVDPVVMRKNKFVCKYIGRHKAPMFQCCQIVK